MSCLFPFLLLFFYTFPCSQSLKIQVNVTDPSGEFIQSSTNRNVSDNSSDFVIVIRPLVMAQMDARIQDPITTPDSEDITNITTLSPPAALWQWRQLSFSDNYLKTVHRHWLSFPPPPHAAHYFLAVLYICIMILGIFGNSLVIFMFIKCKSLRTAANILVTNLAISDMTMMMKMPIFILNSFYEGDVTGEIGCNIYGFVGGLSGTVSIMSLACISIDRYYVVVYPLQRASATLRAKIFVLFAWIYGAVFAGIPLAKSPLGKYVPEGYLTSCSFDYLIDESTSRNFILGYFFAAWVVPFVIICFCYSKIIKVVLQARHMGGKGKGESSRHVKDEDQKKTEIRLAMIVLAIIGLWFAAWTPYAIVALIGISGNIDLIPPLASMVPALFCKTAACLDPFVYAITNQKFRDELGNVFPIFKPSEKPKKKKKEDISSESRKIESSVAVIKRNDSEEGVEEVIVMMDLNKKPTIDPTSDKAQVKPIEMPTNEMKSSLKRNAAAWVMKPTFSNRTSSIRSIARTWNRSKDSSMDENYPNE